MPRSFILVDIVICALVPMVQADEQEAQQALRSGERISTALATVTTTASRR
jgi:hypothetical protein